jgi:hypothetical protein
MIDVRTFVELYKNTRLVQEIVNTAVEKTAKFAWNALDKLPPIGSSGQSLYTEASCEPTQYGSIKAFREKAAQKESGAYGTPGGLAEPSPSVPIYGSIKNMHQGKYSKTREPNEGLMALSRNMEDVLYCICAKVDRIDKPENKGAAWQFELQEDLNGIVSVDSNIESINVPTVTIALDLGDMSDMTKQEILNLLKKNDDFFQATLVAVEDNSKWNLFLKHQVTAESFVAEEFPRYIDNLISQVKVL